MPQYARPLVEALNNVPLKQRDHQVRGPQFWPARINPPLLFCGTHEAREVGSDLAEELSRLFFRRG
jgi:hypothetical protein